MSFKNYFGSKSAAGVGADYSSMAVPDCRIVKWETKQELEPILELWQSSRKRP
jgi:hypothetical protein